MQNFNTIFPELITENFNITELPQSGSSRRNFIAENKDTTYIITQNDNTKENKRFVELSHIFSGKKLNTPRIIAFSADEKTYIQEFLGDKTLSQILEEINPEKTEEFVKKSLIKLHHLQTETKGSINYENALEYPSYNAFPIIHDLYYFKNFLADVLEIPYHKYSLLLEFDDIAKKIAALQPRTIMLRDFQARNIMTDGENVYFIDYQAAMEGPAMYDVISFLYQAKANFPEEFKQKMTNFFIENLPEEEKNEARKSVPYLILVRYLQVLGAYGFRGIIQRKKHFLQSLDAGIRNLHRFLESWEEAKNYPVLGDVSSKLISKEIQDKIISITNEQA